MVLVLSWVLLRLHRRITWQASNAANLGPNPSSSNSSGLGLALQNVVHGPAALVAGSLLELQNLRPRSELPSQNLLLTGPPGLG